LKEARVSFLKKRSKKLLILLGLGRSNATVPDYPKFFARFFTKKRYFLP